MIHADEKKGDFYSLLVEGTDFRSVLSSVGVDPRKTNFNNALVVAEVLGIEAARTCIINEIIATMDAHGIGLDRRHVMLLADVMTYRYALSRFSPSFSRKNDSLKMISGIFISKSLFFTFNFRVFAEEKCLESLETDSSK